jgi:hypothetical protein
MLLPEIGVRRPIFAYQGAIPLGEWDHFLILLLIRCYVHSLLYLGSVYTNLRPLNVLRYFNTTIPLAWYLMKSLEDAASYPLEVIYQCEYGVTGDTRPIHY